jgi:S-adenosylhomocysteine hydrolase
MNGLLVDVASTRIDRVAEHCQLPRSISADLKDTLPFRGLTIGTGIHLEAKTVALLLTLRDGGARLVSTGNLNTTQPEAMKALKAEGVLVIEDPTKDRELLGRCLDEVMAATPDLIRRIETGRPRVHVRGSPQARGAGSAGLRHRDGRDLPVVPPTTKRRSNYQGSAVR